MAEDQNPYAAPDADLSSPQRADYLDPIGRASYTIKAFYAVIGLNVVYILMQFWRKSSFEEYLATESNYEELLKGDQLETAVAVVLMVVSLALIFFFLRWFHLCYKNLPALGVADLDHTPGWAVGWFFIPFANLVKPYSVAYEMWYSSEASDKNYEGKGWVVPTWWIFFLLSSFFDRYVMTKTKKAESLEDYIDLIPIDVASSSVAIIGSIFAIVLVKGLTARQQERMESLVG